MESLSETDEGRLDDRILESIKTIVKTTYNLWVQHPMASASPIPLYNGAECQLDEDADLNALRAQLRSAPDGLAAYDTTLRCIHVSDAVARYGFGRRPDEIVGRMLCDAAPDVAPTLEPLPRHVLETDEPLARVEFSGETPSAPGQVWHWLGDIYPLRNSVGKTIGVGVLGMDEKQGKRAEANKLSSLSANDPPRHASPSLPGRVSSSPPHVTTKTLRAAWQSCRCQSLVHGAQSMRWRTAESVSSPTRRPPAQMTPTYLRRSAHI